MSERATTKVELTHYKSAYLYLYALINPYKVTLQDSWPVYQSRTQTKCSLM